MSYHGVRTRSPPMLEKSIAKLQKWRYFPIFNENLPQICSKTRNLTKFSIVLGVRGAKLGAFHILTKFSTSPLRNLFKMHGPPPSPPGNFIICNKWITRTLKKLSIFKKYFDKCLWILAIIWFPMEI